MAPHQDGWPARDIIAKFLYFQDVMQNITWKGHKTGILPDHTRAVKMQRQKFRECKRILFERCIKFTHVYLAICKIFSDNGPEWHFDDSKKAQHFINNLWIPRKCPPDQVYKNGLLEILLVLFEITSGCNNYRTVHVSDGLSSFKILDWNWTIRLLLVMKNWGLVFYSLLILVILQLSYAANVRNNLFCLQLKV